MSTLDSAYGSAAEVAALVPRYTSSGEFLSADLSPTTRPTLEDVERFLDRISGLVNTYLAQEGIVVPVAEPIGKAAIDELVIEAAVELCHVANSAGRFFTDRRLRSKSPMRVIREELAAWVDDHAAGLENLGAGRDTSLAGQIAYRDTDQAGEETHPIFQRKGFGNRFDNWDR
jgi:hypothetical protein